MIRFLLALLLAIGFFGCESKSSRPMVVSTNLWIGYSPLYYAQKKGWLRENNIKLVHTVSLGESFNVFQNGSSDMLCGTQFEIQKVYKSYKDRGGIIVLDRSNGGDMILSNYTIAELKSKEKVNVYLEIDSVNSILFDFFMKKHELDDSQINFIDKTPDISSKFRMKKTPTIIVTYSPYDEVLKKHGYKEIASTKDSELLVIDGIYTSAQTMQKFPKELDRLNFLIAKSLYDLKTKPKEYFDVINFDFGFDNYDEFNQALSLIEWIYENPSIVINKTPNIKRAEVIKPYKVGE